MTDIDKVREDISQILWDYKGHKIILHQATDQILSTVIPGKVCDECEGKMMKRWCPRCNGTGKLPDVTIGKLLEDYFNASL